MPTLTKTVGQPIICSATFKNTGTKDIGQFRVGFALYGPSSRGGSAKDLGPLAVGQSATITSFSAIDSTSGMPAGNYTLKMYFYDTAVTSEPFGSYDVTDWTIQLVTGIYQITPSSITLSYRHGNVRRL
jgi:hypothetical protein